MDVHPEDLLDEAHAGRLDESGRIRLQSHAEKCGACALENALLADFEAELAPHDGDDEKLDALVRGAMGEAVAPVRASTPRWVFAIAAAVAVSVIGLGALAMVANRDPAPAPTPAVVPPAPRAVVPVRAPAPRVETPAPSVDLAPVEIETPQPQAPIPSAAALFEQANTARRESRRDDAVRTYRQLQALHPRSREAAISYVTLGRLLLDGMDDPQGSLQQFDRYLGQSRHRVLEEEARVGRALALARLGRAEEERRAWQDLIDHHPESLYADRARARLGL